MDVEIPEEIVILTDWFVLKSAINLPIPHLPEYSQWRVLLGSKHRRVKCEHQSKQLQCRLYRRPITLRISLPTWTRNRQGSFLVAVATAPPMCLSGSRAPPALWMLWMWRRLRIIKLVDSSGGEDWSCDHATKTGLLCVWQEQENTPLLKQMGF